MTKIRDRFFVLLIAFCMVLVACSQPATPDDATTAPTEAAAATAETEVVEDTATPEVSADSPSQLRIAIGDDESTLTPFTYVFGYPGYYVMKMMYDSVLELDAENIPQPWLAESVEISDDALTYTLTMRDGIVWHDGEAFSAEDVLFTYEYFQVHPESSRFSRVANQIASLELTDERTLVMTLAEPDPTFSLLLADVPILPQHIWADVELPQEFFNNVGTGPYVFAEYRPDEFYRLTANPDYFMGMPTVDEIIMPIIPDPSTMFSALQASQIDVAAEIVPAELIAQFESSNDITLVQGPGFATTLLQFNNERPPFDDVNVRRAIGQAIDRQELVDIILLGQGTVGNPGFTHPSSPFANLDLVAETNMEAAAATLEEAGYVDGDGDGVREMMDGSPMQFDLLVYSSSPERIRVAELIRDSLAEIGVGVEVSTLDADTVDSLVWPGFDVSNGRDFDLSMWGWSSSIQVSPSRIVGLGHSDPSLGTLNVGGFSSETFDEVANQLAVTVDDDERTAQIRELQRIIADELPFVALYYADGTYAYNADVYERFTYVNGQGIINKLSFIGQ